MQEEQDSAAVAIDFESFWSSDYSLKKMTAYAYVWDARFDAYLVAVSGEGVRWVGDPKDFDWNSIQGRPVLMHNAQFDWLVLMRLQELGIVPKDYVPGPIYDTADLAAFLKLPRNLAGAYEQLTGEKLDKAVREEAKGKSGREILQGLGKDRMLAYGIGDADATYKLWLHGCKQWPAEERAMSRLNREAAWYGVAVDMKHIDESIAELKHTQFETVCAIPWYPDAPALSPKALRIEARKNDMWVPAPLSQTDPLFQKWVAEYGEKYPWVKAYGAYRKVNTMLKRFEALKSGTRPDGTYVYQIKYHGAATGRMSGGGDSGGKFNMQNMPRDEDNEVFDFTTDLRGCIVARPGCLLGVMDYSNVEARILLWRVKDDATLAMIQSGMDVYEAHARTTMGYNLDIPLKKAAAQDPKYDTLRRLAKARCLSGDTLVLTNSGYKPISKITIDDMVWDGVEWVQHSGVICSGLKETGWFYGDEYTAEHELFTGDDAKVQASTAGAHRGIASEVAGYRSAMRRGDEVRELARALFGVLKDAGQEGLLLLAVLLRRLWRGALGKLPEPGKEEDYAMQQVRATGEQSHSRYAEVGAGS